MWALEEREFGATAWSRGAKEAVSSASLERCTEFPPVTSHWLTALPMVPLEGQEKAIWFGIQFQSTTPGTDQENQGKEMQV